MYVDPILKKYADLIESKTKLFKRIYFADPIRLPASDLPCLILAKLGTQVQNMTNVEDIHQVRISMTVVTDVRDTISEDKTMAAGTNDLYNLMEGRDSATYALKTDSLLGIIRNNVELDDAKNLRTDLSTTTSVDYGMTMGKRGEASWSIESTLELTATFTQIR